jgi:organic radical activating enzyme
LKQLERNLANFVQMETVKVDSKNELPVMEAFYTIQGEGYHSGKAAYFIRLAGCNVGCSWCDVKESWDEYLHPLRKITDITKEAASHPSTFVVITGGEPTMHDLTRLVNELQKMDRIVAIETSGTYPLHVTVDWYCFSPKKFKKPIPEAYEKANELKVVINHPSDFKWAEIHAEKVNATCALYLQPEWSKEERFLPMIVEYVKNNPKWNISLQTHKYMNIP